MVSVIIPAFNSEMYLRDAVASVQRQRHANLEIIIVNDGSEDSTPELAADLASNDSRIDVISQPNSGPSVARNVGMKRATGDYISFLDADDTLHPMKIFRQLQALDQSQCRLAFCDYYTADADLVPLAVSHTRIDQETVDALLPLRNVFPVHAALIHRSVIDQVGYFDEGLRTAEDWDFWIRCSRVTSMVHVPGALCSYRRHSQQSHNDRFSMRTGQLRVLRKNYSIGSPQRRVAMAAYHWGEAKQQYGNRHLGWTFVALTRLVGRARTPRQIARVIRLGSYG